ncbi:MAG TPA: nucleoside-diphosphate kinase [Clostridiales bacterium UBA8960]|nr:nucleoside-diphosphate kinase [Clostridiales bacterium UBA8960]
MEKTLVLIKPDAVKRQLVGEIIKTYEGKGLIIEKMKMIYAEDEKLKAHYAIHSQKPFYNRLLDFMKSGPVVAMALSGANAIEMVRILNGNTNPCLAESGSIRGRYASDVTENCVHGSDSLASAEREIQIWFE